MEDIIKKIIVENIPDAICLFEGDSCNLRLIVISSVFTEMPLINQHKKIMKTITSMPRIMKTALHKDSL